MTQNIATLRSVLFDEINTLRAGQSDHKRAAAVASLSKQIISTASLELRFHKLRMVAEQDGKSIETDFVPLPPAQPADSTQKQSGNTEDAAQPLSQ